VRGGLLTAVKVLVCVAGVAVFGFSHIGRAGHAASAPPSRELYRLVADGSGRPGTRYLGDGVRRAGLTFAPATADGDRQVVLAAVAAARPDAARLIGLVDGLVDVSVGPVGAGAVGLTHTEPGGRFAVRLDLGAVSRSYGQRGVTALVLHELGHVVDRALVPAATAATLDAGIPRGWGCDEGVTGTCAPTAERFAESFWKWATGDIGIGMWLGYKVPPPGPSLDAWGAPLAALAAGGGRS
jgi:hypothetical protein